MRLREAIMRPPGAQSGYQGRQLESGRRGRPPSLLRRGPRCIPGGPEASGPTAPLWKLGLNPEPIGRLVDIRSALDYLVVES
ncbi:hypothetical protein EYF80_066436 [Liparis tanakae]|uniref:Uncharacterized protein n=1 Tax=Liparis tanakae TaxID=230148 RepID=A0A4Z2E411_9TELE|nr:hypothetical protein EYF80_066436 [Liparis tanakae]